VIAVLLASASLIWLGVLAAGPFFPPEAGIPLYAFASLICHQLPERSFHLAGTTLPVCARCFGIYAGAALGALGAVRAAIPPLAAGHARWILAAGALPTAVTVAGEWLGLWYPSNAARAAAGIVLGAAGAWVVVASVKRPEVRRTRVTTGTLD
jgi:uncharacterized membrane protein